jgi:predicted dehydrogenase
MSKTRIGFIGAGGMADAHLNGLANAELFPDVEIVAFADVVLEKAQAQAAKYGAKAFGSPATMLAECGLDACYVLLPPFAHGEAERACLSAGVPFLTEKPVGNDPAVIKEIRDEVVRTGLLTAAGYMNRYQPSVQAAKKAIVGDEPILAYGGWLGGPPLMPADGNPPPILRWWVVKEKSGGQMVEQVTHTVDLVRYFLGDAVEVYANTTTAFNKKLPNLMPNYTMDDAMTTTIRFESGALATILTSASTPVGGGVSLDGLGGKTALKFRGGGHEVTIERAGEENEHVKPVDNIFAAEDRQFINAVKTGDKSLSLTDYADAYKTAMLTIGANVSAASGKPFNLTNL